MVLWPWRINRGSVFINVMLQFELAMEGTSVAKFSGWSNVSTAYLIYA
jgi:hypothetical protein|tara:strand:+ start:1518 stop:1661 length:144 start_codon:yes stop_codon:yes gene_type:complete